MDLLNADRAAAAGLDPALLALPEKVVQFGTGAFLRGFADYFIDRANRQGRFGGRVVVVGSTGSGRTQQLNQQDGLYTLVVQGLAEGDPVDDAHLLTAISRALSAHDQWDEVLACAVHPDLKVVVSNTTEVGIRYAPDDRPDDAPPSSFPGKLTAFLYARAQASAYDPARALVVLPCELLVDNGDVLRGLVERLAAEWYPTDKAFATWLRACRFCNTLVDRIVPGRPAPAKRHELFDRLGYRDDLLITAEPYRLWAVQGDEALVAQAPFLAGHPGLVVTPDVAPYRELKVRILNGAHTILVPAALLYGLDTVRDAVTDTVLGRFVRSAMQDEIVPSLSVERPRAETFARAVLDRFANPFIVHQLRSIMLQATMKMRVRVLPSIRRHLALNGTAPPTLTLGFALFLLFHRHTDFTGFPPDDHRATLQRHWAQVPPSPQADDVAAAVHAILADASLWHADLTTWDGFAPAVQHYLQRALRESPEAVLRAHVHTLADA